MRRCIPVVILLLFLTCLMPISMGATPTFSQVSPTDGAVNVSFIGTLKYVPVTVNISDADGNLKNILIETNSTGSWVELTSMEFAISVPYQRITTKIYNCAYGTKYYWRVSAHDNTTTDWTSQIFSFTTESQQQNESEGGGGENAGGNISIFPSTPVSGKLFVIIIDKPIDDNGYVWIQDTLYPVTITGGFGTVQISEEIYGEANLWLYSGLKKTFNIQCGLTGSISLSIPNTITVDTPTDITVTIGGKPVGNAEIKITDPSGDETTATTSNGVANYIFNKVGDWRVRCSFIGQNSVKDVHVAYKDMDVTADNDNYIAGGDVKITTEPNAMVEITQGGIIQIQSITTNGLLIFTPREPGSYKATATLGNKQGTVSFDVYQQANIKVFDLDTNVQIIEAKANKKYMVKVVDSRDQPLNSFENVFVTEADVISPTISLNEGIGFWTPTQGGIVTLHLTEIEGFVIKDLSLTVEGTTDYIIPIIITIVILIVIVLLILFRGKIPKSITDKLKLKPKRQIPV